MDVPRSATSWFWNKRVAAGSDGNSWKRRWSLSANETWVRWGSKSPPPTRTKRQPACCTASWGFEESAFGQFVSGYTYWDSSDSPHRDEELYCYLVKKL